MKVKNLKKQKGFTLVEIAIVLVIIGLLLGGVFKGIELITNAKIKAVTSDFDRISTAYYAYQDRTDDVPGDTNSDGSSDSDNKFWFDLKTEGFIIGELGNATDSDGPNHDLLGVWSVADGGTGVTSIFTTNYICASDIPESYALGIDRKLDDGIAFTGTVRTGEGTGVTSGLTAGAGISNAQAASNGYLETSDKLIDLCKKL